MLIKKCIHGVLFNKISESLLIFQVIIIHRYILPFKQFMIIIIIVQIKNDL